MHAALLRLSQLLVVLALCASVGLHWAAFQTIAWTQMLVSYTQKASFPEAVKKTFDGEHPCDLCKAVQTGQSHEKKQEFVVSALKWDAVLTAIISLRPPAAEPWQYPRTISATNARVDGPPTPPPRAIIHG